MRAKLRLRWKEGRREGWEKERREGKREVAALLPKWRLTVDRNREATKKNKKSNPAHM